MWAGEEPFSVAAQPKTAPRWSTAEDEVMKAEITIRRDCLYHLYCTFLVLVLVLLMITMHYVAVVPGLVILWAMAFHASI